MRRLLVLMMTVSLAVLSVHAQRMVSGKVIEQDTQDAVIQATASLLSGEKVVANAVTNTDGAFRVKAPNDGTFTLKITYVGFKTYTKKITIKEGKDFNAGTISMASDAIILKGATVTARASKVTLKADTFVYNAAAFRTPEGSVVEELVKRLPGAEVSDDGTIKINGKEVKKILVDGKEFMTGDTKTAMKNLPTNIIDRIKAYDKQSDLARVSGIEDGEEETVLDFGIKQGMNRGIMANADIAVGTKDRYSGRIFGGIMQNDLKIFMMTNANNTNDMGFPGGGGGGRWGGGRQGLTANKMTGFNLNYEGAKLKLDGSVRWNHSDGDALSKRSTETIYSSEKSQFGNSISQNYSRSNAWNVQMRLEWTPDSMTNIMFRPSFRLNSSDGDQNSNEASFTEDPYKYVTNPLLDIAGANSVLKSKGLVQNDRTQTSVSYSDSKNVNGMLQFNRRLNNSGRNITVQLNAGWSDGDSKSISNSLIQYYNTGVIVGDTINRYTITPTKNWNYSARLTYSEPILPRTYLQFSYQFQYRYQKSDRGTFDFSDLLADGSWMGGYRSWDSYLHQFGVNNIEPYKDTELSRFSEYQNYIHTAEVMLRIVRKAYTFNVGVQVVPQKSHFIQDYKGVHADTTRTVTNFAPTMDFRWKRSQQSQLRFSYRANTGQPSMSDLLDITDDSDPLNITKGNPGLKPSFTQTFRLNYNDYIQKYQRAIMTFVNFSTTANSISNKTTYNSVTGGRITKPENINGNWNGMVGFMFNTALDSAGYFNVNTFTNLNYTHNVGYVSPDLTSDAVKSVTTTAGIMERLAASYRNDWLEIELNGSVNYNRSRSELQTSNNLDTWMFTYGGMVGITAPWGTSLTTNMNMQSRRGYNDASMNTNELIWNAQLSQSFLKGNALTLSLQLYDILHQQSNLSRAITASMRTDTEYNAITSYGMLHVIYRLNLFGGKAGRQGFGGPGGSGGRRGGFGGPMGRGPRGGGFGGPHMF
jgi:hypothetical protein